MSSICERLAERRLRRADALRRRTRLATGTEKFWNAGLAFQALLAGSGCLGFNLADVGEDPFLLRAQPVDPLLRPGLGRQRGLVDDPAVVKRRIVPGARVILLAPGDEVSPHRR